MAESKTPFKYNLQTLEELLKKAKNQEEELHFFRVWLSNFGKQIKDYVDFFADKKDCSKHCHCFTKLKEIIGKKVK